MSNFYAYCIRPYIFTKLKKKEKITKICQFQFDPFLVPLANLHITIVLCGPGSSVGITTAYGLDGPGIESRLGARFSAPVLTGPEAHPASCTMGTGSFLGVRCCRGVTLTPHSLLVQRSKIEQSYTSTLPKGLRGLLKGETYLHLYRIIYFVLRDPTGTEIGMLCELHLAINFKPVTPDDGSSDQEHVNSQCYSDKIWLW